MKFTTCTFGLVFVILALSCAAPQVNHDDDHLVGKPEAPEEPEVNRGTLWYGVAMGGDRLDVAVRLWNPPSGTTRFFLPGPWAGRSDHANKLSIGEATTPDGPAFLTIDRAAGRVDVQTRRAEWVELRYAVKVSPSTDNRLAPSYRDGVAVLFGPTFLVLPSQQILDQTRDIPVEIHTPDSWSVMTTWSPRAEKPSTGNSSMRVHGFLAADGAALRDAFVVTGTSMKTHAPADTPETTVAFSPSFQGDTEAITALIGDVVQGYREEFGSLGPTRVYVDASPDHGSETLGGVGRRGGFVLQLPGDAAATPAIALLVAHEALHLWNGHHLVPQADAEAATRWFKEGVTHYLAVKSALRWGIIDFDFATAEFAEIAANYLRNPLSRGLEGRNLDHMRFPYDRGALLAFEVDAALARASNGEVGVEDWLRELDEVADEGTYNRDALELALRRIATEISSDAPAVMRRHLESAGPVDLRALFHRADLHWLPSDRSRTARVIALERETPLYALIFGAEARP